ncbi:MAG TPA: hypothetical protein VFY87_21410 [Geminicoccaceae bacterium]|nr:hypothetical protein [Geminicoccaceae bacterium]
MRQTARLVEEIIAVARQRGQRAADIAVRAGIAPANLSRIRRSGVFNADTLERLLAAAGASLEVRPDDGAVAAAAPGRTLAMVTAKLNAGRRVQLAPAELRRLLTRFRPSAAAEQAFSHLVGVLEELPLEQVHDLVRASDATLPSLRRIAEHVGAEGPTVDWLHDRPAA